MTTWMELRRERGELLDRAEAIVNGAVKDGRVMTEDERAEARRAIKDASDLMADIVEAERREGIVYVNGQRIRDWDLLGGLPDSFSVRSY